MKLKVLEYILLNFTYIFCTTTAALIIWGENIRRLLPKLIIYTFSTSLSYTLIYFLIFSDFQFILQLISGFLIAYLVLKNELPWLFAIITTAYMAGVIYILLLVPIDILFFSLPFTGTENNISFWVTYLMPTYPFLVILAYGLRKIGVNLASLNYYLGTRLENSKKVSVAIIIQLIVLIPLGNMLAMDTGTEVKHILLTVTLIIIVLLLEYISLFILIKDFQQQNRAIVISSQQAISENIVELINSLKGQRHDALHSLQIISGLVHNNEFSALNKYLSEIIKEVSIFNEILKIDNPIISALINAKISQANLKGVNIEVEIQSNFDEFELEAINIAKILANLIDNAVDAVLEDEVEKRVKVKIVKQRHLLICIVNNHSTKILDKNKIFAPGFTSKEMHSGLGLYNSRKLAELLNGKLELVREPGQVSFVLLIPGKIYPTLSNI